MIHFIGDDSSPDNWLATIISQNATATATSEGVIELSTDAESITGTATNRALTPATIGTAITFVNDTSAGALTIAITSDTLVLAPDGTTGSRTLAANGMATCIKMTATRWMISGSGLT